jgi:hypothetical protein
MQDVAFVPEPPDDKVRKLPDRIAWLQPEPDPRCAFGTRGFSVWLRAYHFGRSGVEQNAPTRGHIVPQIR